MLTDRDSKAPDSVATRSAFKDPLFYSSLAVLIVAAVVAWILFSRWLDNRQIEARTVQERVQRQKENDDVALQQFGGKELAIQSFYAMPGMVSRGQSVQLCYGVANAKNVKLEPQDNPVWPSYNRCVDVTPKKTPTYTLTIDDGTGHTQSQQLEVKVR